MTPRCNPSAQAEIRPEFPFYSSHRALLCFGTHVFRTEDLANFGLAFPSGPELLVYFHEMQRAFDGLLFRIQLKDGEAANDFFGFAERAVDRGYLSLRDSHACALRQRRKVTVVEYRASFDRF